MSTSTSDAATSIRRHPGFIQRRQSQLIFKVLREPLFHFLVIGALIFLASYVAQRARSAPDRQIVVDARVQRRIVEINQAQNGIALGNDQLARLVEDYIDDEVMYREAVRLGLDRDDEIVRRRLVQKMQFLQRDLGATPPPADSVLRAYYDSHPQLFTSSASVGFDDLFFSADRGGWKEAEARAWRALEQLKRERTSAVPVDDPFPFEIPADHLSRTDAGRLFGNTPIVEALFSAPEMVWSGPVRSAYGWHLIKPARRTAPDIAPYESVRSQVEASYRQQQSQAAERRELDALRAQYEIIRQDKQSSWP